MKSVHSSLDYFHEKIVNLDFDREGEAFTQLEAGICVDKLIYDAATASWFEKIEKLQKLGSPLNLLEHSALLQLICTKHFDHSIECEIQSRALEVLRKSSSALLKKPISIDQATLRLPNKILKNFPREHALFHQAVFHGDVLKGVPAFKQLYLDYFFCWKDLFAIAILISGLVLSEPARLITFAFLMSYAFSSFMEYLVHLYIAHANSAGRQKLKKWGALAAICFRFLLNIPFITAS